MCWYWCAAGTPIFNVRKTWEKILLAARVITAVENPTDVCVLSNRQFGQVYIYRPSFLHYIPPPPLSLLSIHHLVMFTLFCLSRWCDSQRAILKFAHYTGANPIAGRFTPGTFTNQIQKAFREPRLLVISDPATDHQASERSFFGSGFFSWTLSLLSYRL